MSIPNLKAITAELNQRARAHPIGNLQEIRAELHHRRRAGRDIFRPATTFDEWAFHFGGRPELQFNIGLENDTRELRHGVAFSFQRSHALQRPVEVLSPKVRLFNRFMRLHSDLYRDMRMWHWHGERSPDYTPRPIPHKLLTEGIFVFLGKLQRSDRIDYEVVLGDFDRLLDLYEFTEGGDQSRTVSVPIQVECRPGFKPKASSAVATQIRKQWQVILRHNKLQEALYHRLVEQYGAKNVWAELSDVLRTRADVVVRRGKGYWYYEIKTADSPRGCLREALGQLLEYAFWPGSRLVTRLIVVGEAGMDEECEKYLRLLKEHFSLPVQYHRIVVK
jgi:hypothetical protein